MQTSTRTRIRELDVLRGIAVLLVLFSHLAGRIPLSAATAPLWALHNAGWAGVDLFFVLSGFLVSGLIFQEHLNTGGFRIRRFFLRRGLKIYPAFYVFLLLTGLLVPSWADFAHPAPRVWFSEIFFVQNYGHRMWQHTWSLAVEEHFYLLIALVMFFLVQFAGDRPFRWIPPLFFTTAPLVLCLRIWTCLTSSNLAAVNLWQTHLRLDALLFGVLLAYWYHNHREATVRSVHRYAWPILLLSVVCVAPPLFWRVNLFMETAGFTCLYLGFGGIMMLAVTGWLRGPRLVRPTLSIVAWMGVYSYSIYLWHLPTRVGIRLAGARLFGGGSMALAVESVAYLVLAIGVGVVMAKVIEFPLVRVRDRFIPAPARAMQIDPRVANLRPGPQRSQARLDPGDAGARPPSADECDRDGLSLSSA